MRERARGKRWRQEKEPAVAQAVKLPNFKHTHKDGCGGGVDRT